MRSRRHREFRTTHRSCTIDQTDQLTGNGTTPTTRPENPRPRLVRGAVRRNVLAVTLALALGGGAACSPEDRSHARLGNAPTAAGAEEAAVAWGPGDGTMSPAPFLIPPSLEQAVVRISDNVSPEDLADDFGLDVVHVEDTSEGLLVLFDVPVDFDLEALRDAVGVEAADTNQRVDLVEAQTLVIGFFEGEWSSGTVSGQSAFACLSLPSVHAVATGKGVQVAVLDTGADLSHPHLVSSVIPLTEESGMSSEENADGIDDDLDGLIDEAYGHGTHVAGTVVTVAPGAKVTPIRVLNADGIGSLWDVIRGMELAVELGVSVINLSLTLSQPTESMDKALEVCRDNGIMVVAAAGNYGNSDPRYPATSTLAIGVAAVDESDELTAFSGSGSLISLAAPGVGVLSSYPGGEIWYATGTSMAAPIASGCMALIIEGFQCTPLQAARALRLNPAPITPAFAVEAGRVDPASLLVPGNGLVQNGSRDYTSDHPARR